IVPALRVNNECAGDRLVRNGVSADRDAAVARDCLGPERLELMALGLRRLVVRLHVLRFRRVARGSQGGTRRQCNDCCKTRLETESPHDSFLRNPTPRWVAKTSGPARGSKSAGRAQEGFMMAPSRRGVEA